MDHPTLSFGGVAAVDSRCRARSRLASGEFLNAGAVNIPDEQSRSRGSDPLLMPSWELGDLDRRCRSGQNRARFAFALNREITRASRSTSRVPRAPSPADHNRWLGLRHR